MKCPRLSSTLIISDDARIAAQISCALATPGTYLPVIDGPRMGRSDSHAEVARRNNAAARANSARIIAGGLSDESFDALTKGFRPRVLPALTRVTGEAEIRALEPPDKPLDTPPLTWGRDSIGVGVLQAMRSRRNIVFTDEPSPVETVPPKSDHLVVCEEGDDLAQVIAANYAYSLRAGLHLIPEVGERESEDILESFYSLYDQRDVSQSEALEFLRSRLLDLCGPLAIPAGGSLTFVVRHLPYGFAFPEVPSTHLFRYPDFGIAVVNGFAAEQEGTRGTSVALLVDPATTDAPEIDAATELLPRRGTFVRVQKGPTASVREVTENVELYPYDLLLIATHCGDAPGYRWTYEYTDSEGRERKLVVDIAIGVGRTDDADMLKVTQFMRFVSLDGVDWHDPKKKEQLYVGTAINDYIERTRGAPGNEMQPVLKENIPRVIASSVLKMYDDNYILLPRAIADEGMPIVINNACCSWHRLAETFTFCNARAYIGTLFQISTSEAHEVVVKLLDKHYGKPLAHALWSAQREVYSGSQRRPYVVTGIYPQRLRAERHDVPKRLLGRLRSTLSAWQFNLKRIDPAETARVKMLKETIDFYERQIANHIATWFS